MSEREGAKMTNQQRAEANEEFRAEMHKEFTEWQTERHLAYNRYTEREETGGDEIEFAVEGE